MSKIINLLLFKTIAVALFVFAFLLPNSIAWGQTPTTNPRTIEFTVWYVRNGIPRSERINVPGVWDPSCEPWNGKKFTKATWLNPSTGQREGLRIGNVATSLKFPIDPITPTNPNGLHITAAEVNAYWDNYYFRGAWRIGEPTWSENCHGHSTGLGY